MSYFLFSIDSNNRMNISDYTPFVNGLKYNSYNTNTTYTNQANALSYFTTATKTASGIVPSINFSNTDFNALDLTYTKLNSIPYNFALSFYGYFIPTITGVWTFTFNGDDVLSFWIGAAYQTTSNLLSTVTTSTMNYSIVGTPITTTPLAFTSNTLTITSATYTNGTYTASASSILNSQFDAYTAFKGSISNQSCWISSSAAGYLYSEPSGLYVGGTSTLNVLNTSTSSRSDITGEWIQIKLPYSLELSSYTIYPRESAPQFAPYTWYILGSNDGTTNSWVILHTVSGYTFPNYTSLQAFNVTGQTVAYSYFRMIINAKKPLGGTGTLYTYTSVNQWNITGYLSVNSTYSTTLTAGNNYPMLLNYGQASANAKCKMGITPPGGTISYDGTPYLFN